VYYSITIGFGRGFSSSGLCSRISWEDFIPTEKMDDYVCDMSMVGWDRYSIATSPKKYIGKDLIVVKKTSPR